MKRPIRNLVVLTSMVAVSATAQQPSATADTECRNLATQATGFVPGSTAQTVQAEPVVTGDRMAGAARGAAAGAVVGEVQGDRYDNAPDGLQDAHRENQAQSGAAAGVAVAGSRNRQDRRGTRRDNRAAEEQHQAAEANWHNNYAACLQQRGLTPPK